jgi:Bacterial EndoU nuclease
MLAELNAAPILGSNVVEGAQSFGRWAAARAGESVDDYLARTGLVVNVVDRAPGGTGPIYRPTSPIDFDHVIGADYTARGNPTGGHSLLNGDVRIVAGTESAADASGVYKATIQVPDPANPGQWLTKTSNEFTNSMFPKEWTETRIKVEVDAAWNSPQKTIVGDRWFSKTPSGVEVVGYLSPRVTVYPVYQGHP